MKHIQINDCCLIGKHIINKEDVLRFLPEDIRKRVTDIYVCLIKPRWLIFTKDDEGAYNYIPFSGKIEYDAYGKKVRYGMILFWCKAKYLRDTSKHKGVCQKIYTTYVCCPNRMFLLREEKKVQIGENEEEQNFSSKRKWFKAFS